MCTRKLIGEFTSDKFIQELFRGLSQSIIDEGGLLLRSGYIPFDRFTVIDHNERNLGTLPEGATKLALRNIQRAASRRNACEAMEKERAAAQRRRQERPQVHCRLAVARLAASGTRRGCRRSRLVPPAPRKAVARRVVCGSQPGQGGRCVQQLLAGP